MRVTSPAAGGEARDFGDAASCLVDEGLRGGFVLDAGTFVHGGEFGGSGLGHLACGCKLGGRLVMALGGDEALPVEGVDAFVGLGRKGESCLGALPVCAGRILFLNAGTRVGEVLPRLGGAFLCLHLYELGLDFRNGDHGDGVARLEHVALADLEFGKASRHLGGDGDRAGVDHALQGHGRGMSGLPDTPSEKSHEKRDGGGGALGCLRLSLLSLSLFDHFVPAGGKALF